MQYKGGMDESGVAVPNLVGAPIYSQRMRKMNVLLWTVQVLLALLFLFAGGVKLVMPAAELAKQARLPGVFIQFIGVAELLGAFGLILPWLLRIRQGLTPLAAVLLSVIMAGATILGIIRGEIGTSFFPLTVGLLLLLVAYGRSQAARH